MCLYLLHDKYRHIIQVQLHQKTLCLGKGSFFTFCVMFLKVASIFSERFLHIQGHRWSLFTCCLLHVRVGVSALGGAFSNGAVPADFAMATVCSMEAVDTHELSLCACSWEPCTEVVALETHWTAAGHCTQVTCAAEVKTYDLHYVVNLRARVEVHLNLSQEEHEQCLRNHYGQVWPTGTKRPELDKYGQSTNGFEKRNRLIKCLFPPPAESRCAILQQIMIWICVDPCRNGSMMIPVFSVKSTQTHVVLLISQFVSWSYWVMGEFNQSQHVSAAVHLSSEVRAGKIVYAEFMYSSCKVRKFNCLWHKYIIN